MKWWQHRGIDSAWRTGSWLKRHGEPWHVFYLGTYSRGNRREWITACDDFHYYRAGDTNGCSCLMLLYLLWSSGCLSLRRHRTSPFASYCAVAIWDFLWTTASFSCFRSCKLYICLAVLYEFIISPLWRLVWFKILPQYQGYPSGFCTRFETLAWQFACQFWSCRLLDFLFQWTSSPGSNHIQLENILKAHVKRPRPCSFHYHVSGCNRFLRFCLLQGFAMKGHVDIAMDEQSGLPSVESLFVLCIDGLHELHGSS